MTPSIRHSLARAGAIALLLVGGFIGAAHATGTAAGTDITNSATLKYSVGSIAQGDICSSPSGNNTNTCTDTTFKVDNKVNLNIVSAGALTVVPGSTTQTLTFTVSNTGNNTQDYVVTLAQKTATSDTVTFSGTTYADSFDPSNCSLKDSAGVALTGGRLTNVLRDTSRTVLVVCDIPKVNGSTALTNADAAVVSVKAVTYIAGGGALQNQSTATTNDLNLVETIFADGAGSDDSATAGDYSARSAYAIQTSDLKVTKSVITLCDPIGGALTGAYTPKSVPGAYMRYTITIANANTSPTAQSAILTTLEDTLDTTKVAFDGEYITGANNGATPRCNATTFNAPAANAGVATSSGNVALVTLAGGTRATSFPSGNQYLPPAIYNTGTGKISISWASYMPNSENGHVAAELKPGETLTLTFNVIIN